MRTILSMAIVALSATASLAGDATVHLDVKSDTVDVTIGGQPFMVYNFGKDLPKPFFSPVRGPGGTIITRPLKNPEDHPHHKGVWLSVDEINRVQFWAEKGKIQNKSVKALTAKGNPARLEVVNEWLGADGKAIITETSVISIYANRLISYDIAFRTGATQVEFGDTKEGLFGIRLANSLRENEGGHVLNADGLKGTKACWGRTSAWVDYFGDIEGKTFGVTIFDHPLNFRPSRYHVRNYGLFSISPFGEKAYTGGKRPAEELILLPGNTLRLRYGMYIHAGDTTSAEVPMVYQQFLKN